MKSEMKRALLGSMSAVAVMLSASGYAYACGQNAYVGTVCFMAGAYCPSGTVEANGAKLTISNNQALYSLIGCNYGFGSSCYSDFSIPDVRGRRIVGVGSHIPNLKISEYLLGQTLGAETVTQTYSMLAPHTHAVLASISPSYSVQLLASSTSGTASVPSAGDILSTGGVIQYDPVNVYSPQQSPKVALGGVSVMSGVMPHIELSNAGGGFSLSPPQPNKQLAMSTQQPSVAIRTCIVTGGPYPSRP